MYRRPSHFLWELIQNVDDNNYVAHDPTLTITYKIRVLRFDSNETGFTMEDVEAICSMGNSSKTRSSSTRIGRKGIGFKSVFKVAESVYIASGCYSFRFDSRESLGMMIPVWSTFPEERIAGWTSLLLHLSPECDASEILQELERLDSSSILLLRRLRRVHIRIVYDGLHGKEVTFDLTRPNITCKPGELQTLELPDSAQSPLVLYRHGVSRLPSTDSHGTNEQSDIVLVFPQPRSLSSNITCFTFAFLPIRDYGFRFVCHADFDLVANREDVDMSSARNQVFLHELPKAFLRAVHALNSGHLRYTWPYYLPFPTTDSFFEPLPGDIITLLSRTPMLESDAGHLMAPEKLTWVSDPYTDDHNRPLIPQDYSTFLHFSNKYHADLQERIMQLGVNVLSKTQFIEELSLFITNETHNFR